MLILKIWGKKIFISIKMYLYFLEINFFFICLGWFLVGLIGNMEIEIVCIECLVFNDLYCFGSL